MDDRAWDERYAATDLLWTAEPNRFLVAEVADLPPGRALDLACGEGRHAVWLAGRGWEVTAVDFSRVALDKARRLAGARGVEVDWLLADVTSHTPAPGAYDLAVVLYLHLPAEPMAAVLRSAGDAVAPGGTLLVVGHDATNPTDGYGGPSDPSVLYGPADVVAALPDRLVVDKAERVRRPVATADGTSSAVDALVRAHRPAGE